MRIPDRKDGGAPPVPQTRLGCALEGARRANALAISSGLFGLVYGAACAALGVSAPLAVLSCLLVFSGAVQFAALGLIDPPISLAAIAVSSLLISNRLVLMGASIAEHLADRPLALRLLAMPILTDGNWAATVAERRPLDRFPFFVGGGLWVLALWLVGTGAGALLAGSFDPEVLVSLRFAGALFLVLLLLLVVRNARPEARPGHLPWAASALVAAGAAQLLPLAPAFLLGLAAGTAVAWRRLGARPA